MSETMKSDFNDAIIGFHYSWIFNSFKAVTCCCDCTLGDVIFEV